MTKKETLKIFSKIYLQLKKIGLESDNHSCAQFAEKLRIDMMYMYEKFGLDYPEEKKD